MYILGMINCFFSYLVWVRIYCYINTLATSYPTELYFFWEEVETVFHLELILTLEYMPLI